MFTKKLSGMLPGRGLEQYLYQDEEVSYLSRHHPVSLRSELAVALIALVIFLGARSVGLHLIGALALLAGAALVVWTSLQWWEACYVLTDTRVLIVEGVFRREVREVPFKSVIDSSYQRTFLGRLLGYGDLVLNLSGKPTVRVLEDLPHIGRAYALFLALARRIGNGQPPPPRLPNGAAGGEVTPQPVIRSQASRCLCCSTRGCARDTAD